MDILSWLFGTPRRRRTAAASAKLKVRRLLRSGRVNEARKVVKVLSLQGKRKVAAAAAKLLPRKRKKRTSRRYGTTSRRRRSSGYFTMNKYTGRGRARRRSFNSAASVRKSPARIGAYKNPVRNYRSRTGPVLSAWELEERARHRQYLIDRALENELNMSGLGG